MKGFTTEGIHFLKDSFMKGFSFKGFTFKGFTYEIMIQIQIDLHMKG